MTLLFRHSFSTDDNVKLTCIKHAHNNNLKIQKLVIKGDITAPILHTWSTIRGMKIHCKYQRIQVSLYCSDRDFITSTTHSGIGLNMKPDIC